MTSQSQSPDLGMVHAKGLVAGAQKKIREVIAGA
jgi:hypothetical protein